MNYGFGGRLTRDFPSQVIVDVTEVCNLACVHCPHPEFKLSEHYGARFLPLELSEKAVSEVAKHGSQYMRYCAEGEPMTHPRIYDMLDDAVKRSRTFVTLTTNGTMLDMRRIEGLLKSGIHLIDVSIDAFSPDTYAQIRKGGDLREVRQNVISLIDAAQGTKTRIAVSFVQQQKNAHEAQAFESFWTDAGAWRVVIRRLHSAAGALIKGGKQEGRYPCVYPWERIIVSPSGMLKFCPQDWFNGSNLADYRHTTIRETWGGPEYRELREAHLKGTCRGVCKTCPDWAQTRWPGHGLSYANLVADAVAA